MKKTSPYLIALTITLIACGNPKGLTEKEILAALSRFDSAWMKKQPASVDSVLAGGYTYYTQSGGTFDRKEVLHTAESGEYTLEESSRKILSWKAEGATAVVNSIWIGKGTYRGRAFADTQRCSVTLVRAGGEVRILSEHCTLIRQGSGGY